MRAVFISRIAAFVFAEKVLKFAPNAYYAYTVYKRGAIIGYELWVGGKGCYRPVLESEVAGVHTRVC